MSPIEKQSDGCLKTTAIIIISMVLSVGITFWVLTKYVFPREFTPVTLNSSEQTLLEEKIQAFRGWTQDEDGNTQDQQSNSLQPEKYTESDDDRQIELNERELNSMLANNTDLAHRLAIDLSEDLASAKLLIPLDADFPVIGGKTVKLSAGLEMSYADQRPIVILKGVSIMGVPIPNAWLGGLKNVDLISEFGEAGFWKAFSDGVDFVKVEDSRLVIKLKE